MVNGIGRKTAARICRFALVATVFVHLTRCSCARLSFVVEYSTIDNTGSCGFGKRGFWMVVKAVGLNRIARPILKWAGGKTQLLQQMRTYYPNPNLTDTPIRRYVEPFVGGGAVLFDVMRKMIPEQAVICDANPELIRTFRVVQNAVEPLIYRLQNYENRYHQALGSDAQKAMYLRVRREFNDGVDTDPTSTMTIASIERAAQIIFLNKTCFNGLFRVNRKGLFNVPHGSYRNPKICDVDNLQAASRALQDVQILLGDYRAVAPYIDKHTFVYFDPPYRPITPTSSFTAYSRDRFDDMSQVRLAAFYRTMNETGARLMLSNSDPGNVNSNDAFFDTLYRGFNIHRVSSRRSINSNGAKRGAVSELLILNYDATNSLA